MTRSRLNTIGPQRPSAACRPGRHYHRLLRRLPLASAISAILAGTPAVHAATEPESNTLEEVVVTAQKRTENLQDATQVNSYAVGNAPNGPEAPSGTRLPVAPKVKLNLVARETFPVGDWEGFVQGAGMYQTGTTPLLRLIDQQTIGDMPAYALFDLSGGVQKSGLTGQLYVSNVFDKRAQLTRFVECATTTCNQPYIIPTQPRTIGIKFGQKF